MQPFPHRFPGLDTSSHADIPENHGQQISPNGVQYDAAFYQNAYAGATPYPSSPDGRPEQVGVTWYPAVQQAYYQESPAQFAPANPSSALVAPPRNAPSSTYPTPSYQPFALPAHAHPSAPSTNAEFPYTSSMPAAAPSSAHMASQYTPLMSQYGLPTQGGVECHATYTHGTYPIVQDQHPFRPHPTPYQQPLTYAAPTYHHPPSTDAALPFPASLDDASSSDPTNSGTETNYFEVYAQDHAAADARPTYGSGYWPHVPFPSSSRGTPQIIPSNPQVFDSCAAQAPAEASYVHHPQAALPGGQTSYPGYKGQLFTNVELQPSSQSQSQDVSRAASSTHLTVHPDGSHGQVQPVRAPPSVPLYPDRTGTQPVWSTKANATDAAPSRDPSHATAPQASSSRAHASQDRAGPSQPVSGQYSCGSKHAEKRRATETPLSDSDDLDAQVGHQGKRARLDKGKARDIGPEVIQSTDSEAVRSRKRRNNRKGLLERLYKQVKTHMTGPTSRRPRGMEHHEDDVIRAAADLIISLQNTAREDKKHIRELRAHLLLRQMRPHGENVTEDGNASQLRAALRVALREVEILQESMRIKSEEEDKKTADLSAVKVEAQEKEEEAQRSKEEARRSKDEAKWYEAEARRIEADAHRYKGDAQRYKDGEQRYKEEAQRNAEEAKQKAEEAQRNADAAQQYIAVAKRKTDEAQQLKIQAQQYRAQAQQYYTVVKQQEDELKQKELDILSLRAELQQRDVH